jgi:PBP1b-binding outer membrane lipoprotein LpoB
VAWSKPARGDFSQIAIAACAGLVYRAPYWQDEDMAKNSTQKTQATSLGVTASGMVEAVQQDVEWSMEQVKAAAQEAVAVVEEKLGVSKPPARTHKPAKKQKPTAKAAKPKAKAAAPKAKAAKPTAKITKPMKSSAAKSAQRPKAKKRK